MPAEVHGQGLEIGSLGLHGERPIEPLRAIVKTTPDEQEDPPVIAIPRV
jgi:hypothetical protein